MWVLWIAVLGCNLTRTTLITPSPEPSATPMIESGWHVLASGIEWRSEVIDITPHLQAQVFLLRFDPALVTFRVHYSPGDPHDLNTWRDLLPGAAVIVNANFFDESDQALGLVVSEGEIFGQSLIGFGGMFQVDGNGVRVRSLVYEPYYGEALVQAAQGFPMLIENGGTLAPQDEGFTQRSRRTAIGQDQQGRIVLVVIPYSIISLAELQQWLVAGDLNLNVAFGLDGGRSTGLAINTANRTELYPAFDRLPTVIAVYTN